jgi:hypothetical protein
MKMILCPPQARGCRSYNVVAARTGVQVTELRCECNFVLNTGYREQSGIGRCSGSIPRPGGRSFGWQDSGFTGPENPFSPHKYAAVPLRMVCVSMTAVQIYEMATLNFFGAKRLREPAFKVIE